MRLHLFAFSGLLALAVAVSSRAAEKPRATQGNQNQSKKVWTNDDMPRLRAEGLISIVGPEPGEAAAQSGTPEAATAQAVTPFPVYESRLEDPSWYAEKAAALQAELEKREAALNAQQTALAQAADRVTQPGFAMDQPNAGVTPEQGIANLTSQVQEIQNQMDELSDLARQNNIPPGVLRG